MVFIGEIVGKRKKEILIKVIDASQNEKVIWLEKERIEKDDNEEFFIPKEVSTEKFGIPTEIKLPNYEEQLKQAEEDIEEKEMEKIARIMRLAIREAKKIVYEEMKDLDLTPGQKANEIERIAITMFINARGGIGSIKP